MESLLQLVWKETFSYQACQPIDQIRDRIKSLLDKTRGWDFSVNLAGDFKAENRFRITPKWQFATFSGLESEIAYLDGELNQQSEMITKVIFTVRPNVTILILLISLPLLGFLGMLVDDQSSLAERLFVGIWLIVVVPSILILISYWSKKNLKERFIKTFELSVSN